MLSARGATSAAIEAAECLLSLGGEEVELTCLSGPHAESNSAQTDLSSTIEQLEYEVQLLQSEGGVMTKMEQLVAVLLKLRLNVVLCRERIHLITMMTTMMHMR